MGSFDIVFTADRLDDDAAVAIGEIRLDEHRESFQAVLGYWSVGDYESSWLAAVRRSVAGAAVSCLVTSLPDPRQAEFVTTWPVYRVGDDVYVQNQLLFLDELDQPFDPSQPWASTPARTVQDEDGRPISEWRLDLSALRDFVERKTPS
jgi:hypothetical protein